MVLGDASEAALLDEHQLEELRGLAPHLDEIRYEFFAENTGTSRGQNRLAKRTRSDLVLLCNRTSCLTLEPCGGWLRFWTTNGSASRRPSSSRSSIEGLRVDVRSDLMVLGCVRWCVGKSSTTWVASTSRLSFCTATTWTFLGGPGGGLRDGDATRSSGLPRQELVREGGWVPTDAERYYSAEAALLLAHKWSRDELLEELLGSFESGEDPYHLRAAAEFRRRETVGELVDQRDPDHEVGVFVDGQYATHRYGL